MGPVPVRVILANACELVMTRLGVPPAVAEALGLVRAWAAVKRKWRSACCARARAFIEVLGFETRRGRLPLE